MGLENGSGAAEWNTKQGESQLEDYKLMSGIDFRSGSRCHFINFVHKYF